MTKLKVALEWFINPDHLPIIAGIVMQKYQQAGIEVELIEPKEHYDGFEVLKQNAIDIHVNEPIHLFEHHFDGIKSLGCFFETQGGVMVKQSSIQKLKTNQKLKVTTPAANEVTNKIGFEIIKRYAKKEGFEISQDNVEFVQTDFYHLKHLKKDEFDMAWLCFYNFEVVQALHEGFEHLFIDQNASPYANFSALELMSTQDIIDTKGEALCEFVKVTNEMVALCKSNPQLAKTLYFEYTQQEPTVLMEKIIEQTVTRFLNIEVNATKWRDLYEFLKELDLVELTVQQYDKIWELKGH
jgi:ABC-type nitrate/sulfonate/bicarbonate transport system substrate-binding protein